MTDAVIVSTARTPIGKAFRGALNLTGGADLAAHAIRGALDRAGLEPEVVEEVVLGCGYPENATGGNVARHAALVAGIPVRSAGVTVSRFCASGL
ncbi:acetyl-CoA C-acyltransferase, partial [Methylobacterium trifolii]